MLKPTRDARRWLARHGRITAAKALDAIVCGSAWHYGRGAYCRVCTCGKPDTAWHRYYGCELLQSNEDEEIAKSQWVV